MGKLIIGIDCGVNTGFAVKRGTVFSEVTSVKIHQAMARVLELQAACVAAEVGLMVYVEDARLRKWFGPNETQTRSKLQGAGSVKREAVIWQDFLRDHQIEFVMVPPRANMTKTTAEYFKLVTKWQGKTNEHGRDAAMMIVNKRG